MVFRQFRLQCTFRVLLLGVTLFLFVSLIIQTKWYAVVLVCGGLVLYQLYGLIRFIEKTNRDLTRFLQSIQYSDFSQTFSDRGLRSSYRELSEAFNNVLTAFRNTRAEKEEQYRMLQTVVQHVGMGLIAFRKDGEVELINTAAKRLLHVQRLKNIHGLNSSYRPLRDTILGIKPGEHRSVKIEDHSDFQQLALYSTGIKLRGRELTLVSLQNIQNELEEKEMEAWQNLIRVLTHEIMNSVTPISSLASTARDMLDQEVETNGSQIPLNQEAIQDIQGAMQIIQNRSQGLIHFIESYRKLTRIPKPNFQIVSVSSLFDRIRQLMNGQITEKAIDFTVSVEPETIEVTADAELIEQVLINLLVNAIQAVDGQPQTRIDLMAHLDGRGRVTIQVSDNGPGIVEAALDKIFVPFFTTKKEGSGIGLSLSRQIMRLHRGSISVQSLAKEKTVFTLRF
jgi:two-component system nitrogen regulation sensor histidine kinase NtrY